MSDIDSRIERAIAELRGNEALLGMLETDAATEMMNWGVKMTTFIVKETDGLDDLQAEDVLAPRLKAVRSSMRSIGNWAIGKYAEPEVRIQLRDKLLEHFKVILGGKAQPPSGKAVDELLNQVDDASNTPHQLILRVIELIGN